MEITPDTAVVVKDLLFHPIPNVEKPRGFTERKACHLTWLLPPKA